MKSKYLLGRLRPRISQKRRGFTLLEMAITIALAAILLYGLVLLLISFKEVMWVDMQLRNAEEYAMAYVNTFTKHMKNGYDPLITTTGWPSRAIVHYIDPDDVIQKRRLYDFRRDPRTKLPVLYVDGKREVDPYFPPDGDRRDHFEVDPRAFRIYYNNFRANNTTSKFDSSFITLEFSLTYTRDATYPYQSELVKVLNFKGSAYVYNKNWPSKDDTRF